MKTKHFFYSALITICLLFANLNTDAQNNNRHGNRYNQHQRNWKHRAPRPLVVVPLITPIAPRPYANPYRHRWNQRRHHHRYANAYCRDDIYQRHYR